MARVLEKGLAANPNDRYQTSQEFQTALANVDLEAKLTRYQRLMASSRKAKLTAATILATSIAGIVGVPTANRYFNTPSPNISNVKSTLNPGLNNSQSPELTQLIPVKPSPTETAALTPKITATNPEEQLKNVMQDKAILWKAYFRPQEGEVKPKTTFIPTDSARLINVQLPANHPDKELAYVSIAIPEQSLPSTLTLSGETDTITQQNQII